MAENNRTTSEHTILYVSLDNDALQANDRYYTQGLFVGVIAPVFQKNPFNCLFIHPKNTLNQYSLTIAQQMFTPYIVKNDNPNYMDYPYGGTLFFRFGSTSVHKDKGFKIQSSLDFGVRGPYSGAEETQIWFHRITSSPDPLGWDYQVENGIIVNYNFLLEKSIDRDHYSNCSIVPEIQIGTLHTNAKIGLKIELNNEGGYVDFIDIPEETSSGRYNKFGINGWLQANYKRVFYNAILENDIIAPEEISVLFRDQKVSRNLLEGLAGVGLRYRWARLDYNVIIQTAELTSSDAHFYSNIRLSLKLNK